MSNVSLRVALVAAVLAMGLGSWTLADRAAVVAADAPAARNPLNVESLGTMLSALGLKAQRTESRYDFQFAAKHDEEWNLSMSVVLSNDEKSIWVMAWLDELPKAAQDVPRTALLRLLADNDMLGSGKFFAYVSSNRRFVLQRVIANENITSASFREVLTDLGKTVATTYPHWSVANWKNLGATPASTSQEKDDETAKDGAAGKGAGANESTGSTPGKSAAKPAGTRK